MMKSQGGSRGFKEPSVTDTHSLGSTVSLKTFALEPPMEYEEIIQKLEGDVRKHIRIQNQLKLHIESLQSKVDGKFE